MKPAKIAALAATSGLLIGLSLACGGFGAGSGSSDVYSSYEDRAVPPGAEGYPALDAAYRVAPDRALVAVTIGVEAETSTEAAAGVTTKVGAVTAAVAKGGEGCVAAVLDYGAPVPAGGDAWSASAEVRVDVDLRTLADAEARRARIAACLTPLDPLLTRHEWRKVGTEEAEQVQRSMPVLVVDQPETHRDALLARERARLGWAASATGVTQLHPEDLRCVSDGTVHFGDRRLTGVVLELGMNCRIERVEVAAGEGESG